MVDAEEIAYRQDTGGTPPMGACHHRSRFGFVGFPDSLSAGPDVYLVNERCVVYRASVPRPVRTSSTSPPGWDGFDRTYRDRPAPAVLKSSWSKAD